MEKNIDEDISYFRNKIKENTGIVKEARKNRDIKLVEYLDEESKRLENILNFIDLSKEVETHIPKGIEILKGFNTEKIKQAIENALNYIDRTEHTRKLACGFKKMYDKTSLELERYKKIAEKLAEELEHTDNAICKYFDAIDKCKYEVGKDNENTCKQCILDWARKEVENGNNSGSSN